MIFLLQTVYHLPQPPWFGPGKISSYVFSLLHCSCRWENLDKDSELEKSCFLGDFVELSLLRSKLGLFVLSN